jgi:alkyl hydroperoxide reductase subunit AhpC
LSLKIGLMGDSIQMGKMAPNFITVGVYKNWLEKIILLDYHRKNYVILIFHSANFTSVSPTKLIRLIDSPFSHLHSLLSNRSQGGLG